MNSGWVPTIVEAITVPDDVAAWACGVPAGAGVVGLLAQLEPERLSYAGLVDAVVAVERQLAWCQHRQQRLLAALAAAPSPLPELDPAKQWVREELACALRISSQAAADRLELATELTRLPATMALLETGTITARHARTLAEAVLPLDDNATARVEARVLDRAEQQTPAAFARSVRRAVLSVAGERAEQRHQQALTERRVCFTPTNDGMSELWALLPAPGAAALKTVLDALATTHPHHGQHANGGDVNGGDVNGEHRSADQRRADAPTTSTGTTSTGNTSTGNTTTAGAPAAPLPTCQGLRPAVQVTVALSTLLGLDEQPGELAGYGAITAPTARRIAADPTGTWRRLLTDDHGQLLDYGRTTYRPPHNLTVHIITRDGTCRFPGCHRPARSCQLDHQQPWNNGGNTATTNITALCTRHHHLKHDTGWKLTGNPDQQLHWTSPTGRTYTTNPTQHPTDHTTTSPVDNTNTPADDPDPPALLTRFGDVVSGVRPTKRCLAGTSALSP